LAPKRGAVATAPQPQLFAAAIDTPNTRTAYWPREKGGKRNEMPAQSATAAVPKSRCTAPTPGSRSRR